MKKKGTEEPEEQPERRKFKRISKNFILKYFDLENPEEIYEITQLKNISMGGMCFITTRKIEPKTVLGIDLKTPYITNQTYLEGVVLETHTNAVNMLYETRLEFSKIGHDAKFVISKLIEYFTDQEEDQNAEN